MGLIDTMIKCNEIFWIPRVVERLWKITDIYIWEHLVYKSFCPHTDSFKHCHFNWLMLQNEQIGQIFMLTHRLCHDCQRLAPSKSLADILACNWQLSKDSCKPAYWNISKKVPLSKSNMINDTRCISIIKESRHFLSRVQNWIICKLSEHFSSYGIVVRIEDFSFIPKIVF